MTPSRILPDLQCSLLCEEVRQEINGNFILLGIVDVVRVPRVPIKAFRLMLFNRWTAGLGQFTESIRLIAPDQVTVLQKSEGKFAMQNPAINATTITVLGNIDFASAGTYFVEVLVDDVMKVRYPVNLVIVQAPPGSGPPGPAEPEEAPPA
jgi:hypothetical protein